MRWDPPNGNGVVYAGGAMSAQAHDTIYAGPMGTAAYQHIISSVMPMRPLHRDFSQARAQRKLRFSRFAQPLLRALSRVHYGRLNKRWRKYLWLTKAHLSLNKKKHQDTSRRGQINEFSATSYEIKQQFIDEKLADGWQIIENDPDWDLIHPDGSCILLCLESLKGGAWNLLVRQSSKR